MLEVCYYYRLSLVMSSLKKPLDTANGAVPRPSPMMHGPEGLQLDRSRGGFFSVPPTRAVPSKPLSSVLWSLGSELDSRNALSLLDCWLAVSIAGNRNQRETVSTEPGYLWPSVAQGLRHLPASQFGGWGQKRFKEPKVDKIVL